MFDLTNSDINEFAKEHYNNPQCLFIGDFYDDMMKIRYVKRLINKYIRMGVLKERLILNHIISFYNVFPSYVATLIWFIRLEDEQLPIFLTFLDYLNYTPSVVGKYNGEIWNTGEIFRDEKIIEVLRGL